MVRASDARRVVLGDRTGSLEAPPCEIAAGTCVRVAGKVEARGRIAVREVRDAQPGEYDLDDLLDGPRIPVDRMESDLRALLDTIQSAHLRALLDVMAASGVQLEHKLDELAREVARREGELEARGWRIQELESALAAAAKTPDSFR